MSVRSACRVGAQFLDRALIIAVTAGFAVTSPANALTVNNASFEVGTPGVHSSFPGTPYSNWRFGCTNASSCGQSGIAAIGFAPNGAQAGFTSSGGTSGATAFIAQEIAPIEVGAEYVLSVMVGQSPDHPLNGYRLTIGYNATPHDPSTNVQIAQVLFNTPADLPASGSFMLASISGIAPLASAGGWLTIALGSGSYALWDQVTVTQTPLPAALPLFATVLAGGGLIGWRRRRKVAQQHA